MNTLNGKSILFIGSTFFGYAKRIAQHLMDQGAIVDHYSDCPDNGYFKFQSIFNRVQADKLCIKYYHDLLPKLKQHYDYVFIIKGDVIPFNFYKELKARYISAKFLLYIWDDIELYPKMKERFIFFDKIYSFNILDCEKYNLILRPMFFEYNLEENYSSRSNEIFFIGSWHGDRGNVLKNLILNNSQIHLYSHFYINAVTFLCNPKLYSDYGMYRFSKMDYNTMISTMASSKAILDIPFMNQTGLTTRAFEAMGSNTKIITTNKNIRLYDFYNSANISIIDRNNPIVDANWLKTEPQRIPDSILRKYSIANWINDIFD